MVSSDRTRRVQLFENYHYFGVGESYKIDWTERLFVSGDLRTGGHKEEEMLHHRL